MARMFPRRFFVQGLAGTAGLVGAGLGSLAHASRPGCAIRGKYIDRGLPNAAHEAIVRHLDKGLAVVAFTPSGGWVVVSGDGKMSSSGIPTECRTKLQSYLDEGKRINCVAFPWEGGNRWVIVHEWDFYSRNVGDACHGDLVRLVRTEHREVQCVAFEPGGGHSIITSTNIGSTNFTNHRISSSLDTLMRSRSGLRQVAFMASGSAVVLTGTTWADHGTVPAECRDTLAAYGSGGDLITQVAFEGTNDFHVSSNAYKRSHHSTGGLAAVRTILEQQNIPGASAVVIKNGAVTRTHVYGRTERGSCKTVRASTRFQAASVSKIAATVGALRLARDKGIGLDEDIRNRLNWTVPSAIRKITLRQILSHSSGLSTSGYPGYRRGSPLPNTLEILNGNSNRAGVVVNSSATTLVRGDRNTRKYSGGGFTLLQRLIEEETGQSFSSWMRTKVLTPIGMSESGFFTDPSPRWVARDLATNHTQWGWPIDRRRYMYPEAAAAGLYTTARDLAKLVTLFINEGATGNGVRLWDRAMTTEVFKVQSGTDQALGIRKASGFFHGGTNTGARAWMWGNRSTRNGVALLFNGSGGSTRWREAVADAYKDAYSL